MAMGSFSCGTTEELEARSEGGRKRRKEGRRYRANERERERGGVG